MSQALKDRLKELATTRAERRSKRRAEISKRWGEWVHRREFRSVFRRHAWRMARLRRIVELATEQKNPTLKERAEKLIEKEDQRYAQRLEKLKERAASAAGSAAATPSTAPPSVAPATSQD
jgi:hypothetical protein